MDCKLAGRGEGAYWLQLEERTGSRGAGGGRVQSARRRRQLRHAARPLRWLKRELCVVNMWQRLRKRGAQHCATAAGETQPGLDKE